MTLASELRAALDAKAKPRGSLGRLEDLAVQLGLVQNTVRPIVRHPVIAIFAADHGAVASGVSAFPSAVTASMVAAYLAGRAAINVIARQTDARLLVIDAGVAADLPAHPGLIAAKIRPGTADWMHGPAMTLADAEAALGSGSAVADTMAAGGATVVALGEMGIGNTASAALLVHKIAGLPLIVGRGAGLDDVGLARKQAVVAAASRRTAGQLSPLEALSEYGGFEIAMLAGVILRARHQRILVIVDGLIVTAAALVAHAVDPACLANCVFAHRSAEPGHDAMLAHLSARPLLDLGLRLGEGTGAAMLIPLLRMAAGILTDMADLTDLG